MAKRRHRFTGPKVRRPLSSIICFLQLIHGPAGLTLSENYGLRQRSLRQCPRNLIIAGKHSLQSTPTSLLSHFVPQPGKLIGFSPALQYLTVSSGTGAAPSVPIGTYFGIGAIMVRISCFFQPKKAISS